MNSQSDSSTNGPLGLFWRFVSRLRFPWLFGLFALLFGIDLAVPDIFPFVDEILLGLCTLVLGAWRKRKDEKAKEPIDSPRPVQNHEDQATGEEDSADRESEAS